MTYGDDTNKVSYSYDNLGRTAAKTLTVDGRTYETGYSYLPGSNGSGNTTALISTISQPGEAFSYTYDDVGNISSVTRNGVTTTYLYDKLSQLIRVNDPEDTADGTTWVYEYDLGGNILCKKRYAYTTGDLGSVLETVAYEYDSVWKDKLVKYDGNAITYDAIGNPLTDGTWSYTWEKGRQLKQMTKPGTTATFAYNADGLRIRKTVNGVDTNYTLHGKNIVHMTQGSNDLHFWYDAQNRPAIVQFNGEKYGYVVNLQGDIVSLIDNTGTEVVKYVYDAWGKILSTSGSLASTLGTIQPFRYRGYVFDQEMGLYYLRSRYYNPEQCRFVNSDSLITPNLFNYCNNKPVIAVDPSGHMLCVSLYDFACNSASNGSSYDFTGTPIGNEVYNCLFHSPLFRSALYDGIKEEVVQNNASSFPLRFTLTLRKEQYDPSLSGGNIYDWDLYLAARACHVYISIDVAENSDNAQFYSMFDCALLVVSYTISDNYDFHKLSPDEGHASPIEWFNDEYGYKPQESGKLKNYSWKSSGEIYLIFGPSVGVFEFCQP